MSSPSAEEMLTRKYKNGLVDEFGATPTLQLLRQIFHEAGVLESVPPVLVIRILSQSLPTGFNSRVKGR